MIFNPMTPKSGGEGLHYSKVKAEAWALEPEFIYTSPDGKLHKVRGSLQETDCLDGGVYIIGTYKAGEFNVTVGDNYVVGLRIEGDTLILNAVIKNVSEGGGAVVA